jgi:hypothetical protein
MSANFVPVGIGGKGAVYSLELVEYFYNEAAKIETKNTNINNSIVYVEKELKKLRDDQALDNSSWPSWSKFIFSPPAQNPQIDYKIKQLRELKETETKISQDLIPFRKAKLKSEHQLSVIHAAFNGKETNGKETNGKETFENLPYFEGDAGLLFIGGFRKIEPTEMKAPIMRFKDNNETYNVSSLGFMICAKAATESYPKVQIFYEYHNSWLSAGDSIIPVDYKRLISPEGDLNMKAYQALCDLLTNGSCEVETSKGRVSYHLLTKEELNQFLENNQGV